MSLVFFPTFGVPKVLKAAENAGAEGQMQLLQDVVGASLSPASASLPPQNCTTDCGAQGSCPEGQLYYEEPCALAWIQVKLCGAFCRYSGPMSGMVCYLRLRMHAKSMSS